MSPIGRVTRGAPLIDFGRSDTMATIPGHITDEVIILGNHRDGSSTRLTAV